MIRIVRGPEPPQLAPVRAAGLAKLRAIVAARAPCSEDFGDGYDVVKLELWQMQHRKCCYCEHKTKRSYNDVEHFRPKTRADRRPSGSVGTGYWWLAWTWENLLFSCSTCNRSEKNDAFPLGTKDELAPEGAPPGLERPLVIDPAGAVNPMMHLRFVHKTLSPPAGERHWYAEHDDTLGFLTIWTFGLNHADIVELRDDYARTTLKQRWEKLEEAIREQDKPKVRERFEEAKDLFRADQPFAALAYDALTQKVPDSALAPFLLRWPARESMPLPPHT